MFKFLFYSLGRYKEPVALMVIGVFIGPYFMKQAISAFAPLMAESRNIRDDLKQEIRASEERGKEYADLKADSIMNVLTKMDERQTRMGRKIDEIYRGNKVSSLELESKDNTN